MWLKICADPS